jgi:hypothetical protein
VGREKGERGEDGRFDCGACFFFGEGGSAVVCACLLFRLVVFGNSMNEVLFSSRKDTAKRNEQVLKAAAVVVLATLNIPSLPFNTAPLEKPTHEISSAKPNNNIASDTAPSIVECGTRTA